jgi:hypothetical protein
MGMKQYTSAEMAQKTDRSERTVRQLAEVHGIGRKFGHVWVFAESDIAKFKAIHKGGPKGPRKPKTAAPSTATTEPTP